MNQNDNEFSTWLRMVDAELTRLFGVCLADLVGVEWNKLFNAGYTPFDASIDAFHDWMALGFSEDDGEGADELDNDFDPMADELWPDGPAWFVPEKDW